MNRQALLGLLAPTLAGLAPPGAPPDYLSMLFGQGQQAPTASYGGEPLPGQRKLRGLASNYGWNKGAEWDAIQEILARESGGNRLAQNPTSTAYGRWQFLNGTWDDVGGSKTSNRRLQDIYGLRYLAQRYGDPLQALAHHNASGWY